MSRKRHAKFNRGPNRSFVRLTEADEQQVQEREYSAAERQAMAKTGEAMEDGSFPIRTAADVEHAVRLWGHSENPKEAKAHIVARAKALGVESKLPYSWDAKGNSFESSENERTKGDLRFLETDLADVRVDADKHILEVTLIRAGTSRNGNHYPAEVLREAVPLFEGARAFADHQGPYDAPERSVRDLVGSYKNVHLDEAGRLRGELHLIPGNDWLFNLLKEAEGNPDLCGLSIDAWGKEEPNQTKGIRKVTQLTRVMSCDIVTRPSAGGAVDRLIQSERPTNIPKEQTVPPENATQQTEAENRNTPTTTPAASQQTQPGHRSGKAARAAHRRSRPHAPGAGACDLHPRSSGPGTRQRCCRHHPADRCPGRRDPPRA